MGAEDRLYKAFLEEINALEAFRIEYASLHPSVPLERDDPDVRRMVEAIAYFSARTKMAGMRNIEASRLRLFQQFFPYLLAPLPASGMLRATPSAKFAETVNLPEKTEIAISTDSESRAIFHTTRKLRIMPLEISRLETVLLPQAGHRMILYFEAPFPTNEDIGEIRFHINYLDDFFASLKVYSSLQHHLKKVSVCFDEDTADENSKGSTCKFSFGGKEEGEYEFFHPIQKERLYFQSPISDMFLNVAVSKPPRNWRRFILLLDIDRNWPENSDWTEVFFSLIRFLLSTFTNRLQSQLFVMV